MRQIQRLIALIIIVICSSHALAFQILTPQTEPCHEKITLAALDVLDSPYSADDDIDGLDILEPLFDLALQDNIDIDKGSVAFTNKVTKTFDVKNSPLLERFVISSFVAGVRFPDTQGIAIIKFNETRSLHIRDENQIQHSLRRSTHDGIDGNIQAVKEFREHILTLAKKIHKYINNQQDSQPRTIWTFPFYGEVEISVYNPAFILGQIAHTIQDSYAHSIRDDDLQLISVANYADIVTGKHNEGRDGPGHSERLDQCDINVTFDALRFAAARRSTAAIFSAIVQTSEEEVFNPTSINDALDDIYNLREGCDLSNQYCDVSWRSFSMKDITEPISISLCGVLGSNHQKSSIMLIIILLMPLAIMFLGTRTE